MQVVYDRESHRLTGEMAVVPYLLEVTTEEKGSEGNTAWTGGS